MNNTVKLPKRLWLILCIQLVVLLVGVAYWLWIHQEKEQDTTDPTTITLSTTPRFTPDSTPILAALNQEYTSITAAIAPVLVSIDTRGVHDVRNTTDNAETYRTNTAGVGSGVIISTQGHIITAHHVIKDKQVVRVRLNNGQSLLASIIGYDSALDIAVLKIDANISFEPLPLGDSDKTSPGEIVLACGNPYGLGPTITRGLISARERRMDESGTRMIQTDAPIFPGNSGGPLINTAGEIVGINKGIIPGSDSYHAGIGFAIPANTVLRAFRQICKFGHTRRGYIGIDVIENSQAVSMVIGSTTQSGVVIDHVKSHSPAQQSGLLPGDLITKVDDLPITSISDLFQRLEQLTPGEQISFEINRKGTLLTKSVTTVPKISDESPVNSFLQEVGIDLRPLTIEEQAMGVHGVLVTQVHARGSGASAFQDLDLITSINDTPVTTPEEVVQALQAGPCTLNITRGNNNLTIMVE